MGALLHDSSNNAARCYGAFSGINDAIGSASSTDSSAVDLASGYRHEMIQMALLRSVAMLSRDGEISFQRVYRYLQEPSRVTEIVDRYALLDRRGRGDVAKDECRAAVTRFCDRYRTIDFKNFGKLQKFRNYALAHVSSKDVNNQVEFRMIEEVIAGCSELAKDLVQITRGQALSAGQRQEHAYSLHLQFWSIAFEAEADGRLPW
jgi:hypothetical protein